MHENNQRWIWYDMANYLICGGYGLVYRGLYVGYFYVYMAVMICQWSFWVQCLYPSIVCLTKLESRKISFQMWTRIGLLDVAAWCNGNIIWRINEVAVRRARLLPGWHTTADIPPWYLQQATQDNSASCPQQDMKWVPAKGRWCYVAGE